MKHRLVLFHLILLFYGCTRKDRALPEVRSITESVYASGVVKAEDQYQIYPEVNGIIQRIHVSEGDTIAEGSILFTIEKTTPELNVENARVALKLAEENMKKLKDMEREVLLAKENMKQDSLMYQRYKKLWDQDAVTQVAMEEKELAYESSKTVYQNRLNELNQSRRSMQLDYQSARNNLRISLETAKDYTIRSNLAGKVFDVFPEVGELVSPQMPLAVIGNPDSFLLELQVDEDDLARVEIGQEVLIIMDSFGEKVFKATLSAIHPILEEGSGTFTVEAVFVKAPPRVYPNVSVEANIIIHKKEKALVIPREYLVNESYVLIEPDEKRKVEVGLKNYEYAEITEGLSKDQYIYKP